MKAHALRPLIVPLAVAILIALFAVQSKGTARIGRAFGPVMAIWFVAIAVTGAVSILGEPRVLAALNPLYGIHFLIEKGTHGFLLLGSVVLVITGAEALYADLGHFGRTPIRIAWFSFVLPALVVNYFGQGAVVLRDPAAAANPFYALTPGWTLYPMRRARDRGCRDRFAGADLRRRSRSRARPCSSATGRALAIVHTSRASRGRSTCPRSTGR